MKIIENYLIFEMCEEKKFGPIFKELYVDFTKKIVTKYGFAIRDPEKTYTGSRIQGSKSPGSRIRIRNTDLIHASMDWTGLA
jgi:hypothetical protein